MRQSCSTENTPNIKFDIYILSNVPVTIYLNIVDENLPVPVPYSCPHFTLYYWGQITQVSWAPDTWYLGSES